MRSKCVDNSFQYIINDDFNPDMIQCGLLDCYDSGFRTGVAVGSIVVIGFTSLIFARKVWSIIKEFNFLDLYKSANNTSPNIEPVDEQKGEEL